tara:strand:+ start:5448 stop:7109 length:1662 start_codon:yes stop_codon:yes gene_type:complete
MFLVDALLDAGEISLGDLESSGKPTDHVDDEIIARHLLESGKISPIQLIVARAKKMQIPSIDFSDFILDASAISAVPADLCKRHGVIPIKIELGELYVAMSHPGDVIALDDLRSASGMQIRPVLAEPADLRSAFSKYFRFDDQLSELSSALQSTQLSQAINEEEQAANDAPIVRFVNLLISQAISDRASDIHIEPGEKHLRVRYRIDGVLHEMHREPKEIQPGVISRIKIMSDIDIAERRKPQDGRLSFGVGAESRDLRVATLPTVWGENIVLRILDDGSISHSVDNLGFRPPNLEIFNQALARTNGMILVTGPTGSGKSTTLYATLSAISHSGVNIITVEDPVEYRMPDINQIQVNARAGLSFASALRSILRADPDIVLVGEIRDRETAQIALEASLTGHMVLSTLHTNDAPSSLTRMVELGVEPYLVASSVTAIIAQRLARRLCAKCKIPVQIDESTLTGLSKDPERFNQATFFKPAGCNFCSNTGYRGRLAIHELMVVTEEIQKLTMANASSTEIASIAEQQGLVRLLDDGLLKAAQGLTSIEEILRVVG